MRWGLIWKDKCWDGVLIWKDKCWDGVLIWKDKWIWKDKCWDGCWFGKKTFKKNPVWKKGRDFHLYIKFLHKNLNFPFFFVNSAKIISICFRFNVDLKYLMSTRPRSAKTNYECPDPNLSISKIINHSTSSLTQSFTSSLVSTEIWHCEY